MKTISIRKLALINFRGIKDFKVSFRNQQEFNIYGANRTGKSTIMTAFIWLLFGKDQFDRKDFEIKPLTSSGEPEHNLDSTVEAEITIDDEVITLKKVFREVWQKPRGSVDVVFKGHETLYYYNDVPCSMREYDSKIAWICPEELFKLLTNPLYFPSLSWQRQRTMLFDLAGKIDDMQIAEGNKAWIEMLNTINGHKTLEEYKKQIAAQKSKISEDLDKIPARIDEVKRGMPEEKDWKAIEAEIADLTSKIAVLDSKIADAGKGIEGESAKRAELQNKLSQAEATKKNIELRSEQHIQDLQFGHKSKVREKENTLKRFENIISQNEDSIKSFNHTLDILNDQLKEKKEEWYKIRDAKFVEIEDETCPTCGQRLPQEMIDADKTKLLTEFNESKARKRELNEKQGREIKARINEIVAEIEKCQKTIADTVALMDSEEKNPLFEPDYEAKKKAFLEENNYNRALSVLSNINKEITTLGPVTVPDTTDFQNERRLYQGRIDIHKRELANRDYIESGNRRIENLKDEQRSLAQKKADLEKIEFNIQGFVKARIEAVEGKINGMFSLVRFRMFKEQINGGEAETCELTVDGVPFSNLNNAARYQSGLDIIRALSQFYKVSAPVFLDNRESVTDIPEMNTQIINLIVDPTKQTLTV